MPGRCELVHNRASLFPNWRGLRPRVLFLGLANKCAFPTCSRSLVSSRNRVLRLVFVSAMAASRLSATVKRRFRLGLILIPNS
jgi:hypothetical protein